MKPPWPIPRLSFDQTPSECQTHPLPRHRSNSRSRPPLPPLTPSEAPPFTPMDVKRHPNHPDRIARPLFNPKRNEKERTKSVGVGPQAPRESTPFTQKVEGATKVLSPTKPMPDQSQRCPRGEDKIAESMNTPRGDNPSRTPRERRPKEAPVTSTLSPKAARSPHGSSLSKRNCRPSRRQ